MWNLVRNILDWIGWIYLQIEFKCGVNECESATHQSMLLSCLLKFEISIQFPSQQTQCLFINKLNRVSPKTTKQNEITFPVWNCFIIKLDFIDHALLLNCIYFQAGFLNVLLTQIIKNNKFPFDHRAILNRRIDSFKRSL